MTGRKQAVQAASKLYIIEYPYDSLRKNLEKAGNAPASVALPVLVLLSASDSYLYDT
jgi:hypothetical protein